MFDRYGWTPYIPVADRRARAAREVARRAKKGHAVSPVTIEGRTIARTFWGKAWCDNLERYSDYENRLPRGRTYVRNGSVVDLQIGSREILALVSGSRLYKVAVKVTPVPKARWSAVCGDCAGGIDSLVELLQGRLSKAVMERICRRGTGLFPSPDEIEFSCSCPDWASMCKHVAAALYGVGARLDDQPELLFNLRAVDQLELIAKAGRGLPLSKKGPAAGKVLGDGDLAEIFGLEMADGVEAEVQAPSKSKRSKRRTTRRPAVKKKVARATKRRSVPKGKKSKSKTKPKRPKLARGSRPGLGSRSSLA